VDDAVALRLLRGEIGTIDRVLEDSIRLEYQQSIQISSVLALGLSDEGILRDPLELAGQYADLRRRFPHINVLGGGCGTDHRHVGCISAACRGAVQAA